MPKIDISKYSPESINTTSRNISIDDEPDKSISIYYGSNSHSSTKKTKLSLQKKTPIKSKSINTKHDKSVTNSVTNSEIVTEQLRNNHTNDNLNANRASNKGLRNNSVTDSVTDNAIVTEQLRNSIKKDDKLCNNSVTNSVTVTKQLRNSKNNTSVTNSVTVNRGFYSLSGIPKNLLYFLGKLCIDSGSRITPPINFSFIREALNISSNEVTRINIHRLIKKGLIRKIEHKTGKGGYQILAIEDHIYKDLTQHILNSNSVTNYVTRSELNSVTNQNIPHTQSSVTNSVTSLSSSSSSSSNIYTKETTSNEIQVSPDQQNIFELPDEWLNIDFSRIQDFGFGIPQLKQLYKLNKFSAENIQEYINRLDFDITESKKTFRTGIVNGFMGILRKNDAYAPPNGYESPMYQLLREELEKKTAHLEKIKKMKDDLFQVKFETWKLEASVDELESIEGYSSNLNGSFMDGLLRDYFKGHVFEKK